MKLLSILAAVVLSVSADGCTISSDIPLGSPESITFDRALLGKWSCVNTTSPAESGPARVYAFSDSEYYIQAGPAGDAGHFRAFATRVDDAHLLNVQELEFVPPGSYYIVGYEFPSSDTLTLRPAELAGNDPKPKTQEALLKFIRERLADGKLFEHDGWDCERAKPEATQPDL